MSIEKYKGKAKCSCGKRAHYRVYGAVNGFSCNDHKERLSDKVEIRDSSRVTEADRQTWMRV